MKKKQTRKPLDRKIRSNTYNTLRVVCIEDPALEWASDEDRQAYAETRDIDLALAAVKGADQPVIYTVRAMTLFERLDLGDRMAVIVNGKEHAMGRRVRAYAIFKQSIVSIENIVDVDGLKHKKWEPSGKIKMGNVVVPDCDETVFEWIDENVDESSIIEIGGVADDYNFLVPKKSATYRPPLS